MKRSMTLFFVLLFGSLLALIPGVLAQDGEVTPEATPEAVDDTATYLRFAHFAPNAGAVDVYINEELTEQTNLSYPSVTDWIAVDSGFYDVDVTLAGAALAEAVISVDEVGIGPGFVTVAVVEGTDGQPTPVVISETREDLLPGTAGVTFLNALSTETVVNFDRDDVPFAVELGATTQRGLYVPVDAGTYTFTAYDTFAPETEFGQQEVQVTDGSFYLIAVIGNADEAQLFIHETTGGEFALVSGEIEEPGTLIEAVQSREALAAFPAFFESAGLTETLRGEGPYTVFLPAEYLTDEIEAAVGGDMELLTSTLQNHVIEGNYPLGQLIDQDNVTTLGGNTYDITIEGNSVFIGGYQILRTNIFATNGVIHVIDGILGVTEPTGGMDMDMEATEEMGTDMDMEATEEMGDDTEDAEGDGS